MFICISSQIFRYKPGEVWLEKDLILPYVPNVELCDAKCLSESESRRDTLLFFRGRLKRNAVRSLFELPAITSTQEYIFISHQWL